MFYGLALGSFELFSKGGLSLFGFLFFFFFFFFFFFCLSFIKFFSLFLCWLGFPHFSLTRSNRVRVGEGEHVHIERFLLIYSLFYSLIIMVYTHYIIGSCFLFQKKQHDTLLFFFSQSFTATPFLSLLLIQRIFPIF